MSTKAKAKRDAVVALITITPRIQLKTKVLVVWNTRYHGWAFPGGLVEAGEKLHEALAREVREETGLTVTAWEHLHDAPAPTGGPPGRGEHVYVFRTFTERGQAPVSREKGCPVKWMTIQNFLKYSPFRLWYWRMFTMLDVIA